jgi:hypothetical protein
LPSLRFAGGLLQFLKARLSASWLGHQLCCWCAAACFQE